LHKLAFHFPKDVDRKSFPGYVLSTEKNKRSGYLSDDSYSFLDLPSHSRCLSRKKFR